MKEVLLLGELSNLEVTAKAIGQHVTELQGPRFSWKRDLRIYLGIAAKSRIKYLLQKRKIRKYLHISHISPGFNYGCVPLDNGYATLLGIDVKFIYLPSTDSIEFIRDEVVNVKIIEPQPCYNDAWI